MKWAKAAGFATSRILLANTGRADGTGGTIKWVTVGSCSVVARLVTNVLHEFMQDSTGHDGSVDPRDSLECEWLLVRSELPSDRLQARLEGNDWHKRVMLWGHQAMHRDTLLADESTNRCTETRYWLTSLPGAHDLLCIGVREYLRLSEDKPLPGQSVYILYSFIIDSTVPCWT